MINVKRPLIIVSLVVVLFSGVGMFLFTNNSTLTLYHPRTDEVFMEFPVQPGDEFTLRWIHSVEKTPWEETLLVKTDGSFSLTESRFQSYGAGTAAYGRGDTRVEDGYIVTTHTEEDTYETYNWYHSHDAQFALHKNGSSIVHWADLPHHQPIEMAIEAKGTR
ncbi:DUF1850 domain-containing protein [Geomicrobium sp. JCM 19039]|uniref:DUF1850 domain-containing protein n=1 Tax=Geomicrobium sp. JCM 19039 TaxID=1460636 RepID=UPI000694360C|nr:DUF1850 domain-containing protein [Geomicrobium sp. JCM 19039]